MPIDLKTIGKVEWIALGTAGLVLFLSLFSAYIRVSVSGGSDLFSDYSSGTNAWTSYAVLGMLLLLAAAALLAVRVFLGAQLPAQIPWYFATGALAVMGTFLVILRAITASDRGFGGSGIKVSAGPGWSGWLMFLACFAFIALAVLLAIRAGEGVPDLNRIAQGGKSASAQPPAQQGPPAPPTQQGPPAPPTQQGPPAPPTQPGPPAPPAE